MSFAISGPSSVASRRKARGWSQEELAARSGVPRSSVSAVEAGRLTPSVTAALAVARALECSVEELFGAAAVAEAAVGPAWAWEPRSDCTRYWEAEVGGRRLLYPVEAPGGGLWAHDGVSRRGVLYERGGSDASRTLVLVGCDPAAGLLASEYAAASGFRLLPFLRGGGAALDLLRQGAVHVASLHRSTQGKPEHNAATVGESLGAGYRLLRGADWEEGLALPAVNRARSAGACTKSVRRWAVRELGSAARECLEELLERPCRSKTEAHGHAAVAEAVRGGWAEAGVCVRLSAEEAGLRFLPVRVESLDLCFPAALERDPRVQALIGLLRSRAYRRLVDELPGYDARRTGEMASV